MLHDATGALLGAEEGSIDLEIVERVGVDALEMVCFGGALIISLSSAISPQRMVHPRVG
jgi:hypothetical protein